MNDNGITMGSNYIYVL